MAWPGMSFWVLISVMAEDVRASALGVQGNESRRLCHAKKRI